MMSQPRVQGPVEQGPIRPPSEAGSLLLRVTRHCAWNRCSFCPLYKDKPFSCRSSRDVAADICVELMKCCI